jgi:CRP/FNR family transcriptional regulator, cyclic AMP receptor protein
MAFATLDVAQRVANFLIHLMDVHGTVEQGGIVVRMPLTQQDIADSIGASRRAVARALASLKEQGILNTGRREFVVVRPDVLAMCKRAETPAALRR